MLDPSQSLATGTQMKESLKETEAAEVIGMSVAFLRAGRIRGVIGNRTTPPPYLKLGGAVRYLRADLLAWMASHRVDHAAKAKARKSPSAA